MNSYTIRHTNDITKMEEGRIATTPWGAEYRPDARFYIGWSEDHLDVYLRAYEVNPVADVTERNGNVCRDSCLEFFFSTSADNSTGYFNFEMNSNPTLLLHYGLGNKYPGRECVEWPLEDFELTTEKNESYWQNHFIVPLTMLKKYVPSAELKAGQIWRANLYKCGNTRQINHYLTWNDFDTTDVPRASFHQPKYFGELVFAE